MRDMCLSLSIGSSRSIQLTIVAAVFFLVPGLTAYGQAQTQKPPSSQGLERKLDEQSQEQADDVVRVRTDLVQTSVTVIDKRGKAVGNLRAEDFELRIDGKPCAIQFFDRIINGVADESLKTSGPRDNTALTGPPGATEATRTVLFFVDDLHLSAESMNRTRKVLSTYIEQEMRPNDSAVIASASGQIGFLQQFTNERDVLRAAAARLSYRPQTLLDNDRPRMSAYQALSIERNDPEILRYFVEVLLNSELVFMAKQNPQLARNIAEQRTRGRASRITRQSGLLATQTLASLRSAVRSSAQLPGRKLFFFISDGFFINNQNSDITNGLLNIADAAVHAGAVLYTIQASGLNTTFADASSDAVLIAGIGNGRVFGEDTAAQDPLTQLAADTGGKALLNANDLNQGVKRALQDSSDYYLLSWRPETEAAGRRFHKIEVTVKGRSDLSVLVQRGFFNEPATAAVVRASAARPDDKPKTAGSFPLEELAAAIQGKLNNRSLPTYLTANYLDLPIRGASLSILMQVENRKAVARANDKPATIDVAGVVYNDSGKVVGSFTNTLAPEPNGGESQHVTFLDQVDVKPGLYQVRVAARDAEGLTGMAMQWVKVPELSSHQLALSSLLIGQRGTSYSGAGDAADFQKAQLKIDRRFVPGSRLRVLTFIYNAANGATGQPSQLNARIDIFRGNDPVVSTPARAIETKGLEDMTRIPYAGEINLASLAKGPYRIRLTVLDLGAKTFASREASFEIE